MRRHRLIQQRDRARESWAIRAVLNSTIVGLDRVADLQSRIEPSRHSKLSSPRSGSDYAHVIIRGVCVED
jgi:hypothetical protein